MLLGGSALVSAGATEPGVSAIFGAAKSDVARIACFARSYSAAHLEQHPIQNVRSMTLLVYKPDRAPASRPYAMLAGVKFKTRTERFDNYGECTSANGDVGPFDCRLECDAGHVRLRKDSGTTIYVEVPAGSHLRECGEDVGSFGADDRTFKLERVKASACLPLVPPSEAMQYLRDRLSKAN